MSRTAFILRTNRGANVNLHDLLDYDPETGALTWKPRSVEMFADTKQSAAHSCAIWNGRYAGKRAFTKVDATGYCATTFLGRTYSAHRVIWALVYGEWPVVIDHVNGIRSDNRLCNLRNVTGLENMRNQKRSTKNKTGVVGVRWCKIKSRWRAQINYGGRLRNIGYFKDFDQACAARKAAEQEHGYHPNHGRAA